MTMMIMMIIITFCALDILILEFLPCKWQLVWIIIIIIIIIIISDTSSFQPETCYFQEKIYRLIFFLLYSFYFLVQLEVCELGIKIIGLILYFFRGSSGYSYSDI